MYVENGGKAIKGLGQMQGRQIGGVGGWGRGGGVECLSTPPDFKRIFFNCSHMLLCTGYFYMGGGGGGGLAPIKLI